MRPSIIEKQETLIKKHIKAKIIFDKPLNEVHLLNSDSDEVATDKMYRDLVESAHEGLTIVDSKDNLIFLNSQFAANLGYKVNELKGVSLFSLAEKKSATRIKKEMALRKKGKKTRYEVALFHRDRTLKYFLLSASPRYSFNNVFIGSTGVYADITNKKDIELKLLKRAKQIDFLYKTYSDARVAIPLNKVFNGVVEGVVQTLSFENCAQAKIIFDGKAYTYPKKIRKFALKIEVPLMVAGVKRGFLQVGYGKKCDEMSLHISLSEERDLVENVAEILKKHVYARELVGRYKMIVTKAFTGITIVQNAKIKYANPRFCKMLKYKESAIIGKGLKKFLPHYQISKVNEDGKIQDSLGLRSDKQEIYLVTTRLKTTHNGKPALLLRVIDVTALKKAEDKLKNFNTQLKEQVREKTRHLRKVNKRLQAMNVIKDEFVAVASHELRSPLTSIRGYLSFLMEDQALKKMDKQYKNFLKKAYANTVSMNSLVDNILDASRLDMGRFTLKIQKFEVIKFTKLIVDGFQFQAGKKKLNLELVNEIGINEFYLKADSLRMSQVLSNLIDNAIKFTRRGKNIKVSLRKTEISFFMEVFDQGVGIPKEKMQRIFEKFTQIRSFNKKDERGVGLGLFITKRIVELHRGKIKAEANKDRGTTVTVIIPLKKLK